MPSFVYLRDEERNKNKLPVKILLAAVYHEEATQIVLEY